MCKVKAGGAHSLAAGRDIHFYSMPHEDEGPPSLDDRQHEALMREQRRREEFKTITGGIDEWRPRRLKLQDLISRYELDPKEIGELYKHGYLSFKGDLLSMDRSKAPVIGAALLWGPGNMPSVLFAWSFFSLHQQSAAAIAFLMFAIWFATTSFMSARIMRRWYTGRRIARRITAGPGKSDVVDAKSKEPL